MPHSAGAKETHLEQLFLSLFTTCGLDSSTVCGLKIRGAGIFDIKQHWLSISGTYLVAGGPMFAWASYTPSGPFRY